jgi:hypothetical protein
VRKGMIVEQAGAPAESSAQNEDGLLPRLRVIEDQPLDQRAAAFTQVHDELQTALEGGNTPPRYG